MPDLQELAASLRRHAARKADSFETAALNLLIEHEVWLRYDKFQAACIQDNGREWYIRWRDARDFLHGLATVDHSTSELAILRTAVLLATDEYRLSVLDWPAREAVADAFATALRTEERHG